MSIERLSSLTQNGQVESGRALSFQAQDELSATLTRGDILKGKVLRQYDSNRYGVDFGGKERVVDSAVPLKLGEMIQGRVLAVDEKVHLQRIVGGALQESPDGGVRNLAGLSQDGLSIGDITARFLKGITADQRAALSRLSASAGIEQTVVRSALVISKLGLPLEPEFVRAVLAVFRQDQSKAIPVNPEQTLATVGDGVSVRAPSGELVAALASAIQNIGDVSERENFQSINEAIDGRSDISGSEGGSPDGDSGKQHDEHSAWRLGHWLLNAQDESSVGHKYLVFPVWLGERLVEVEIALFAQRDQAKGNQQGDPVKTSRIALSLTMDQLGKVDILLHAAERRLRFSASAESEAAADELAQYLPRLRESLNDYGWAIDEASYSTRRNAGSEALELISHHFVAQDSLSQLM